MLFSLSQVFAAVHAEIPLKQATFAKGIILKRLLHYNSKHN